MIELIALAVLIGTAVLILLSGGRRRWAAVALAAATGLWGVFAVTTGSLRVAERETGSELLAAALPRLPDTGREPDDYVGSGSCRACHPGAYASWMATYHRRMTQVASAESVLGDFNDVHLTFDGRDVHLTEDEQGYWIEGPDPDWELAVVKEGGDPDQLEAPFRSRRRVVMTTGSHHQQAYWIPSQTNDRMLINFPLTWLLDQSRWVPREAVFLRPPDERRLFQLWNGNCVHCHAVAGKEEPNYSTGHFKTSAAELGIACEACHGPAGPHVADNRNPVERYRRDDAGDESIIQPARLTPQISTQVCGQCHAITMPLLDALRDDVHYAPGDRLDDTRTVIRGTDRNLPEGAARLEWSAGRNFILQQNPRFYEQSFWDDGLVRLGGREYTALLESPCYQDGGLSCLTCHSMHDYEEIDDMLRPGMRGDTACVDCHETIAADITAHTHHPARSSGSLCMNCHMPFTTSGLVKVIRAHTVTSPDSATDRTVGRPNACTLCHLDRPLAWVGDTLASWYDLPVPAFDDDDRTIAAGVRWLLEGDAGQRSVVAGNAGFPWTRQASGESWLVPILGQLLDDPYAVVRAIAERSLRTLPGQSELVYDYVGTAEHRAAAAASALSQWRSSPGQYGAALLVRPDGTLDLEALSRHLSRRDDHPMDLQE